MARIGFYYLLVATAMVVLVWQVPWAAAAFTAERLGQLGQAGVDREIVTTLGGGQQVADVATHFAGWRGIAVATISMLSALIIMLPVAWTYVVIKRRGGYDQSVVHTLLILPLAVTGIVIIVQNSLALAFSLAGIVAAVRFRTTLEDTKDAVYVFLAIGVGLACGVQAVGIALALSVVFDAVNLVLWRLNFGNLYADQFGRTGALGLGDILAGPESAPASLTIGDRALMSALSPRDLGAAAATVARMEKHLEAESDEHKERKRYAVLLVYSDRVGEAQEIVEPEVAERSIRWRLAEILPHNGGVFILEYLVRMKDGIPAGALLDAIRRSGGTRIQAAEFRSLEGLRKK